MFMTFDGPVTSRTQFTRFALPGACHIASANIIITNYLTSIIKATSFSVHATELYLFYSVEFCSDSAWKESVALIE